MKLATSAREQHHRWDRLEPIGSARPPRFEGNLEMSLMAADSLGIIGGLTRWLVAAVLLVASPVAADDVATPAIKLAWVEGDISGFSTILAPDTDRPIGYIEYHQRRRGDVLEATRVARFYDGSSDEDTAHARVGATLRSLRGRSIIRNTRGMATVDISIDVEAGHISGFSGLGKERKVYDERVALPEGTYWGPLIFLVIKNFDGNAVENRLVFRTVVPTPKPRVIDLELLRKEKLTVHRAGARISAVHFVLRPTANRLVEPILRRIAPDSDFFVESGAPPAFVLFKGPRNFGKQKIRIE